MGRLKVGDYFPEFTYCTPYEEEVSITETVGNATKTAIVFLRYYGCTLCQFDMMGFAEEYDEITENGGQLLVVLQSDPVLVKEQLEENPLPFEIICDPDQELYEEFEIKPAESREELVNAKDLEKIRLAQEEGIEHGEYEGDELQLPAYFILDRECEILAAHYGETAGDVPTAEELAELLA